MWPQPLSNLKPSRRVKKAKTPWQSLQWPSSLAAGRLTCKKAEFEKRLDVQQGQSQDLDREEVGPWEVGWGCPGRNTWELGHPHPQVLSNSQSLQWRPPLPPHNHTWRGFTLLKSHTRQCLPFSICPHSPSWPSHPWLGSNFSITHWGTAGCAEDREGLSSQAATGPG